MTQSLGYFCNSPSDPTKLLFVLAVGFRWRGDCLEAEAFAYLAIRHMEHLPLSLPTTTGVPFPMVGGNLHKSSD